MNQDPLLMAYAKAEKLANFEMISPQLAAVHYFCTKGGKVFKDVNQVDRCLIDSKEFLVVEKGATVTQQTNFVYLTNDGRVLSFLTVEADGDEVSAREFFGVKEEQEENVEKQQYFPLHGHTEYSVGDALCGCKELAKHLKDNGYAGASVNDHGTLAGTLYFQRELAELGLQPVLGMEAYVVYGDEPKKGKYRHMTIMVKNKTGWDNLLKLNQLAQTEGYYYKPRVLFKQLLEHHEGLVVLSGCLSSEFQRRIQDGDVEGAKEHAAELKSVFGDDFYIEIMPNRIPLQVSGNKVALRIARELGVKPVTTLDYHYVEAQQKKVHDALKAIIMRKPYEEAGYDDDVFYILDSKELYDLYDKHHGLESETILELMRNTFEVAGKCDFQITKDREDTLPRLYEDGKSKLRELVMKGLEENTPYFYAEVKERIELELDRVFSKNYENYFLIVHDYVKWCHENGVLVGPGRGSVGGSLLAYAIGITTVDPLEHDLLFDRFISEVRKDAPDIDLDFQDDKRQDLLTHLKQKYGADKTSKIVTYARWHGKGALRDIARVFNLPQDETNKVCNLVIERSGGDSRSNFCLADTFLEFEQAKEFKKKYPLAVELAIKLEGRIRHRGIHAAGLVITEETTGHMVPTEFISGELCTAWEKKEVENMGLIKFDILGLKTLSVIKEAMRIAGVDKLPTSYDDKRVYETVFVPGNTLGVFQFETPGLTKLSKNLSIDDFKLLYDATTLYRPGPLNTGQTHDYVKRRQGKQECVAGHPLLEPLTRDTKGLILYQEQVMRVMYDLGKFSWATAETTRKIMTKRQGKKMFEKMRLEFVDNAEREHKIEREEAEKIFDVVSTFGAYGFNKSHAVEYSIISYWCAWLKTYHKQAFYCALMSKENDTGMLNQYVRDARENGIQVLGVRLNKSKVWFTPEGDDIRIGYAVIKGIGEAVGKRFAKYQPYKTPEEFLKVARPNKAQLRALAAVGAFDDHGKQRHLVYENGAEALKGYVQQTLFGKSYGEGMEQEADEWDEQTRWEMQYEYLPVMTDKTKLDFVEDPFEDLLEYAVISTIDHDVAHEEIWVKGMVEYINFKQEGTEGGAMVMLENVLERRYAHVCVNDGTGRLHVHVSPEQYTAYKHHIERVKDFPVIIKGHCYAGRTKVYCDGMIVLDNIEQDSPIVRYVLGESERRLQKAMAEDTRLRHGIVRSVQYRVSKKNNPYARVTFTDGTQRMDFKLTTKVYEAGELVSYEDQDPFMRVVGRN